MNITLEKQLDGLAACGIRLLPEITSDNLLATFDRTNYEKQPFLLLLTVMGGELDVEPFTYASDDVWHFDTECIEDHNAYVRMAQRLVDLAGTDLPLEDIVDYVDIEEGKAWLSFKLDGQEYKWTAVVEDDWVDPTIMSRFAELLGKRQCGKRFTYHNLGGQDCLIGCSTPEELESLRILTGLSFVWLE
jgi:hypothetical protein